MYTRPNKIGLEVPHELGIGRPSLHVLTSSASQWWRRGAGRTTRSCLAAYHWRAPPPALCRPSARGCIIPCSEPPVAGRCGAAPGLTSGGCGSHRTHAYLMRLELPPPPVLTAQGSHQGLRCDVVARIIRGARTVNMVGELLYRVQRLLVKYLSTERTVWLSSLSISVGSLTLRSRSPGPRTVVTGRGARAHNTTHNSKQLQPIGMVHKLLMPLARVPRSR